MIYLILVLRVGIVTNTKATFLTFELKLSLIPNKKIYKTTIVD